MADVTDTPRDSCTSRASSESLVAWPFDFTNQKDSRKYLGHQHRALLPNSWIQPQPLTSWDHPCALRLALTLPFGTRHPSPTHPVSLSERPRRAFLAQIWWPSHLST